MGNTMNYKHSYVVSDMEKLSPIDRDQLRTAVFNVFRVDLNYTVNASSNPGVDLYTMILNAKNKMTKLFIAQIVAYIHGYIDSRRDLK